MAHGERETRKSASGHRGTSSSRRGGLYHRSADARSPRGRTAGVYRGACAGTRTGHGGRRAKRALTRRWHFRVGSFATCTVTPRARGGAAVPAVHTPHRGIPRTRRGGRGRGREYRTSVERAATHLNKVEINARAGPGRIGCEKRSSLVRHASGPTPRSSSDFSTNSG